MIRIKAETAGEFSPLAETFGVYPLGIGFGLVCLI